MFTKKILLLILVGFLLAFGIVKNSDFNYSDQNGNDFVIKEYANIPKIIDTTFLKNNMNGMHFENDSKKNAKTKFKYVVEKFEKINKLEYKMRIFQSPLSKKIEDIIRFQGFSVYKISLEKTKTEVKLVSIKYMFSEI